ncbi:T9SS type A sorting domain-containing protein [Parabacteroides chongii]|uniref:T9SS type A sorting domain-containing protein n=1 Tax=Parabacteroides chongii TaxID=2685834 RepID=UPI00240DC56D|nr:T9SS type A sorting domain-containing protein [Parabacteroides chongii]WFE86546.1 T9SS type A sorting domain-containing protein [Parabacteroides chongii]
MKIKSNILFILLALLWMPVCGWAQDLVDPGEGEGPGNFVAEIIGTEKYKSLKEAFATATKDQTISLLVSLPLEEELTVDKAIVLDLNGLALTGNEYAGFKLDEDVAKLTITNGAMVGSFNVSDFNKLFVGKDVNLGQTAFKKDYKGEELYRVLAETDVDLTEVKFYKGNTELTNYSTTDDAICFWIPASQVSEPIYFTTDDAKKVYATASISISSHSKETLTFEDVTDDPNHPIAPDGDCVITFDQPAGGKLTVTANGIPITSGGTVTKGTEITINAKSNSTYYQLALLLAGNKDLTRSTDKKYTVKSNTRILAVFFNSNTSSGGSSGGGSCDCPSWDYPDWDFDDEFEDWMDSNYPGWEKWWNGNIKKDFTILVRKTGLGTVTPGTTGANRRENITFKIDPAQGQQIVDVRINGNSVGAVNEYKLKNIQANTIVDVVFSNIAVPVYTLTSKVINTKEGTASPTSVRVTEGSNHDFNFYPSKKNCVITDVKIGPKMEDEKEQEKVLKSIGKPEQYIFTNVQADSIVVVTFDCPTANESISAPDYMIYTEDKTVVVNPENEVGAIKIYDLMGRIVCSQAIETTTRIPLTEGIYVVVLTINDKQYVKKVSL